MTTIERAADTGEVMIEIDATDAAGRGVEVTAAVVAEVPVLNTGALGCFAAAALGCPKGAPSG